MSILSTIVQIIVWILAIWGVLLTWVAYKGGAFSAMRDAWKRSGESNQL